MINQKLQHQIEIMRAQKHIELSGPIEEVNNYVGALSRIFQIANEIRIQDEKLKDIRKLALSSTNDRDVKELSQTMSLIVGICDGNYKAE